MTPQGEKVPVLWFPRGEVFGTAALLPGSAEYLVSTEAVINSTALVCLLRAAGAYLGKFESDGCICVGRQRSAAYLWRPVRVAGRQHASRCPCDYQVPVPVCPCCCDVSDCAPTGFRWCRGNLGLRGSGTSALRTASHSYRNSNTSPNVAQSPSSRPARFPSAAVASAICIPDDHATWVQQAVQCWSPGMACQTATSATAPQLASLRIETGM